MNWDRRVIVKWGGLISGRSIGPALNLLAIAIFFGIARLEFTRRSRVLAALQINHRFRVRQLLQDALQRCSQVMRGLVELQRRANSRIHAGNFAF
jgi:hypothetical protein